MAGPKPKNDVYSHPAIAQNLPFPAFGAVAQLIERVVRNDEVVGLIPICSTSFHLRVARCQGVVQNSGYDRFWSCICFMVHASWLP